jgi:ABC-type sugar transport system permease subunit
MRNWLYKVDTRVSPYLYISPFFILFAVFGLFPLAYTAYVSLFDWSLLRDDHTYIGFGNYRELFADPYFWNALGNTISILVLSTVPQLIIALVLAHLINRPLRGQTAWRLGMLLPNVTSVVAVAVIFSQLFGRDFGLINAMLESLHLGRINWQAGTASSHIAISVMIIWQWSGYNALIFLAAMQAVPKELYESARLDGATEVPAAALDHDPRHPAHAHLRRHRVHHLRAANLCSAPTFRRQRPAGNHRRVRPAVPDADRVPLRARVQPRLRIRLRLGRRVGDVRPDRHLRRRQLPPHAKDPQMKRRLLYLTLLGVLVFSAFPLYFSLVVSTKDNSALSSVSLIPGRNLLENIRKVFETVPFGTAMLNSLIVAGTVTASVVLFSTLAGFAFSKAALSGPYGTAADGRGDDDGADTARHHPALHPRDQARMARHSHRGHRPGVGERVRGLLHVAIPFRGAAERAA